MSLDRLEKVNYHAAAAFFAAASIIVMENGYPAYPLLHGIKCKKAIE